MYRHKHHSRFGHPRHAFPGMGIIWMIGLGFLFLHGWWWPGILILVGLSMLVGSIEAETAQRPPEVQNVQPPQPAPPPAPVQAAPAPFLQTPAAAGHRVDLLPATCPRCGGPIRAHEVKWTGVQAAACPYCGTNLPMHGMRK